MKESIWCIKISIVFVISHRNLPPTLLGAWPGQDLPEVSPKVKHRIHSSYLNRLKSSKRSGSYSPNIKSPIGFSSLFPSTRKLYYTIHPSFKQNWVNGQLRISYFSRKTICTEFWTVVMTPVKTLVCHRKVILANRVWFNAYIYLCMLLNFSFSGAACLKGRR